MDGWAQLVHEVDRAASYEQIEQASERFRQVMGENTARVLVMLVTAALAGGGRSSPRSCRSCRASTRAAAWAEAQGAEAGRGGRSGGGGCGRGADLHPHGAPPGWRGGCGGGRGSGGAGGCHHHHPPPRRQPAGLLQDGQRWHVPANRSIREIPARDPVGRSVANGGQTHCQGWGSCKLTHRSSGQRWIAPERWGITSKARIMERRFRGQWVEKDVEEGVHTVAVERQGSGCG